VPLAAAPVRKVHPGHGIVGPQFEDPPLRKLLRSRGGPDDWEGAEKAECLDDGIGSRQ